MSAKRLRSAFALMAAVLAVARPGRYNLTHLFGRPPTTLLWEVVSRAGESSLARHLVAG